MNIKQIVFTDVNKAELLDMTIPEVEENCVVVKMHYTAISSGTERANITGDPNVSCVTEENPEVHFPRFLGYSGSGVIVAVGEGVTKFKVGDAVATRNGCHKSYQMVHENEAVKCDIPLDEAAFLYISTFPMAAVRKTRVEAGESGLVMGLGILGLFAVQQMKASGAAPLIAADPVKERRELALKLGADYALDPLEDGFADKVKEITGGGINAAIEVTGVGAGFNEVLDCMAKYGRVALLGCTRNKNFTVDYYRKIHYPGITVIGAHTLARPNVESHDGWWTHNDDMKAVMRLVKYGRISIRDMICEVHKPGEAPEVYKRLVEDRNFPVGVLFDWRDTE